MIRCLRKNLVAATVVTLAVATAAGTNAVAAPVTAAPHAGSAAGVTARQVTLPTGDVVTVSVAPDGRQSAAVAARQHGQGRDVFQTFTLGGDLYVVPETSVATAARNLGAFDVSRLAGLRGGSTAGVRPNFPMKTLTLQGIAPDGTPDTGDSIVVYNIDNMQKYAGFVFFNRGIAKVSVPQGHYTAFGFFYDFSTGIARSVMLPQFTVNGDTTVTVDSRDATSPVTIRTPKPADPQTLAVELARSDRLGNLGSYAFLGGGSTQFYVQPVPRAPRIGQLHYFVYARMFSPEGVNPAYTYDVKFPSDDVIPVAQNYVATPATLASVASTYTATHPDQQALDTRFAFLPWEQFGFGEDVQFTEPTYRVEYYTARPDLTWQALLFSVFDPRQFYLLGGYQSAWRTYEPRTRLATTWGGGQPIHPVLLQTDLFPGQVVCPACVSGSTLDLLAFPFGDQDPQHFGFPDYGPPSLHESMSYAVSADGRSLASSGGMLDAEVTLPASYHRLLIDYTTYRSSPDFTLSTSVRTRWTVRGNAPVEALPSGWLCTYRTSSTACGVLPLMTNSYQLPANDLGQLASGRTHGSVTIGHLAGAAGVVVTSLTVDVSFDGGATWGPASVTSRGSGNFGVTFTVPTAGRTNGYGAIRVSAKDALGGTFDQTIKQAFAIGAP